MWSRSSCQRSGQVMWSCSITWRSINSRRSDSRSKRSARRSGFCRPTALISIRSNRPLPNSKRFSERRAHAPSIRSSRSSSSRSHSSRRMSAGTTSGTAATASLMYSCEKCSKGLHYARSWQQQFLQLRQRHTALSECPIVEVAQGERAAFCLLVLLARLQPAPKSRVVRRQLTRRELRPLQFGRRFLALLVRVVDHQIERLLIRHAHRLQADVQNRVGQATKLLLQPRQT